MGDFIIDLLDVNNNNLETYVETMFDYNFYPLINKPTRIVKDKFSAIDHIWTNVTGAQIKCHSCSWNSWPSSSNSSF